MKRIRLYLLALVVSFGGVSYGDTNDISQLYAVVSTISQTQSAIYSLIQAIDSYQQYIQIVLDNIDENTGEIPVNRFWVFLQDALTRIRDKVIEIEYLCNNNLPYLQCLESISISTAMTSGMVNDMLDSISELDGLADSLQDIIDYASQVATDVSAIKHNTDGVATEETLYNLYLKVQEIHGMLQSIDPTSILNEIDAHLEEFITNWQYMFTLFDTWGQLYFDVWTPFFQAYNQYGGYPTLSFRYYTLTGSPQFANGYQPVPHEVNYHPNSMFEFLNYAVSHLLDVSTANNEISLFIAKYITTNGQAEVLADFQNYARDIISELEDDYSTLREIAYDNTTLTFNPSTMPLGNVKALFDGLDSRDYSVMRSEPVIISGFNALDSQLPSYFTFQYDLTPMQSLIEIARVVFSTIWILLFCSMFLWMCFKFRRLYNWLFSTMVSNAPNQSALTNMPI